MSITFTVVRPTQCNITTQRATVRYRRQNKDKFLVRRRLSYNRVNRLNQHADVYSADKLQYINALPYTESHHYDQGQIFDAPT